jgi:pimeloyl-ACP methyl ester carboxylesterase
VLTPMIRLILLVLVSVVAVLLMWAAASGLPARAVTAARILDELRRPRDDSWLRRGTPAPLESIVTLEHEGRRYLADVYRPARGSGTPLLLIPGAVEEGKDDPRVAPFARLLARAGFIVIVPDLPSLRAVRAHPDNVHELADAVIATAAHADLAPEKEVGMFGISYAGGIALRVALEPRLAERVRFVATVGTYADLERVLRFLAGGKVIHRGHVIQIEPDPYGQLMFIKTYEEFLSAPQDRARLDEMMARRWRDPHAALDDLAVGLTPQGRVIYDLFENAEGEQVPHLFASLHEGMKRRIAELSPARRDFGVLKARLYLVHDRHDATIPFTESHAIADLARGHVPVRLEVLESLHHVELKPWHSDPTRFLTRDLPEALRLGLWWCELLEERSRR